MISHDKCAAFEAEIERLKRKLFETEEKLTIAMRGFYELENYQMPNMAHKKISRVVEKIENTQLKNDETIEDSR